MKTITSILRVYLVVAALFMVTTGCQKKRTPQLGDGEGRFSEPVSKYDGKVFSVKTREAIGSGGVISSSEDTKQNLANSDSSNSLLQAFPAVKVETDAKLVDSVPFLAKPNTDKDYEVHYSLTNSHLVVSKVAKADLIPFSERTYAEKLADGRLSVPLFGYPIIGKIVRETVRNEIGQQTSRITERNVMDISEAQFVQIDFTRFEEFGAIKKVDTFPVNFFTGEKNDYEWYYGETILNTPDHASSLIGDSSTFTLFDVRQSLIKFNRTQNGLEVIGLAADPSAQANEANLKRVAFFPGEFKEFRVRKAADKRFRQLREEEVRDDEVHWSKRDFIKIDFSQLISEATSGKNRRDYDNQGKASFNPAASSGLKLIRIQLDHDFISVLVESPSTNIRYNLAFLRKKKNQSISYDPLIYHELDNRIFGYYATQAPVDLAPYRLRNRRERDLERSFFVNRFNPKRKVIEYHLSKNSPEWATVGAEKAIAAWNEGFQKANTGIQIVLNKDKRVETGDIRYNIINLIDAKTAFGSLAGYGPVLSDPFSGEVVSAVSTVHLSTIRQGLAREIRNYVLSQTGALPQAFDGAITNQENTWLSTAQLFKTLMQSGSPKNNSNESSLVTQLKPKVGAAIHVYYDLAKVTNREFRQKYANYRFESQVPILIDNTADKVKKQCPELESYISSMKSSKKQYDDQELGLVENCAQKLTAEAMIPTLVHELGHNFGLRHNYGGSADSENFSRDREGKLIGATASIMDYVPSPYETLMGPGEYDIAAIRYAYSREVELKSQDQRQFAKLNRNDLNISDNLSLSKSGISLSNLRKFKYCTDAEAKFLFNDPMCELHDVGTTPDQVTNYWIKRANEVFLLGQYKWDRAQARSADDQAAAFFNNVDPLMKFYAFWREKLAEFMKKRSVHLEGYDKTSYRKVLAEMERDREYGEFYKTYYPIAEKIKKFLMGYALLPDYYCLVENRDTGSLDLIEFDSLRKEVYGESKQSIRNCTDNAASELLEKKRLLMITEFGYTAKDIRFDLSDEGLVNSLTSGSPVKSIDMLGTTAIKQVATQALLDRISYTFKGLEMELRPSIYDEPDFREQWLQLMTSRIVNGLSGQEMLAQVDLRKKLEKIDAAQKLTGTERSYLKRLENARLSPRFKNMQDQLSFQAFLTKKGLSVPGQIQASLERSKPLGGSVYDTSSSANGVPNGSTLLPGVSFVPNKEAVLATAALNKYMANRVWMETTPAKIDALVEFLASLGFPKTDAEAQAVTVGQMMNFSQALQASFKQLSESDADQAYEIQSLMITVFPEVLYALNATQEVLASQYQEIEKNSEVQALLQKNDQDAIQKKVAELLQPHLVKKMVNVAKDLKIPSLMEKTKSAKLEIDNIKKLRDEIGSQQDLILMLLLN